MDERHEYWVFGYGSLCWNPGFDFKDSMVGYVQGFSRKFWQGNIAHRGTKEKVTMERGHSPLPSIDRAALVRRNPEPHANRCLPNGIHRVAHKNITIPMATNDRNYRFPPTRSEWSDLTGEIFPSIAKAAPKSAH